MSTIELNSKVKELRELRRFAEEIAAEIEQLQDEIKAEMTARSAEEINGNDWRITWKAVKGSRLDSKKLKAELPEVAARYTVTTETRRFTVA